MKPLHLLLALGVVAIWGFNFVVIEVALREFPPLFLCALRFALAAVPAVFFIPRPDLPVHRLAAFGLFMFALQFALLFSGMKLGLSAGLASLVLQLQVFVTIAFAAALLNEKPTRYQLAGAIVAFGGIALVALNAEGAAPLAGLVLVILAATCWGTGNYLSKKFGPVNMLALVVWGSLVAPLPMLGLSLALEGPARIGQSLATAGWLSAAAVAYIVYPTTLLAFAAWSSLLGRYPAATVAPLTLLVPFVAMSASALVLGEPMQTWKLAAAAIVIAGLALNVFGARLHAWLRTGPLIQ